MATSTRPTCKSIRPTTPTVSTASHPVRSPIPVWLRCAPRPHRPRATISTSWPSTTEPMRSPRTSPTTITTCRSIRCSGIGISERRNRIVNHKRVTSRNLCVRCVSVVQPSPNNFRHGILPRTAKHLGGPSSMSAKNRPYEQFGSFILFKKLESDALGDLWRAGRVDGGQLGPIMAVRRLSGGNRAALLQSAAEASQLVPLLSGTTFAKDQTIDVANGIPFVAHEYAGGRSLRHIVDRARGGNGLTANPIPIDQAIVIAEKVALSLSTTADLKFLGNRLAHGALIPQFVWITDEGEIRVGGQQLGKGLIASMSDTKVAAELGRYFAAEYRASGDVSKTTDVYSLGAILYLLITGVEPPDAVTGSAFAQTIRAAKTFSGQPLPDDLRAILEKSLAIDPNARYATIGDMKQVLSALVHGGNYSASTFNLAFYLSNLLKKELEGEALERDKESKVSAAAYAEVVPIASVTPMASSADEAPVKSRMALY